MKVLLNTTTLNRGGALQTSSSFILQSLQDGQGIEWIYALSPQVVSELQRFGAKTDERMVPFDELPSHSQRARKQLSQLEGSLQPDCVFTFSGPAYVRFHGFHLMGCSNPWITHGTWTAFRSLIPRGWADNIGRSSYRAYWFTQADAWVMQTASSKQGLVRRLRRRADRIAVISNTCGDQYLTQQESRPHPQANQPVRILVFSAPYRQKNLDLIPHVAKALAEKQPQRDFKFVLTLPHEHAIWREIQSLANRLQVADRLENVGVVRVADGPALYRSCDICLLPTLLETFSATYPEAMAMGLPIVTTNFGFARDVCGDAALYYRARDGAAAADCILKLLADASLWQRLIANGKAMLQKLPTPEERYRSYTRLLHELHENHRVPTDLLN